MPFDREGAKAAGYSDAEIDSYLGQQAAGQGVIAPAQPGDVNPLVPIGITAGGLAAGGYGAVKLAQKAPALARVALEHAPFGIGTAVRGAGMVKAARDAMAKPAGSAQARSNIIPLEQPRIPANMVQLTRPEIKAHPELKAFKPGDTIGRATLAKIKLAAGQGAGPTRPITMEGKAAKAPANTPPNGPGVGRGKSGLKLAREAAYREGRPPAGSAASRAKLSAVPETAAPSLEEQLAQSVSAEQAMSRAALAPAERQFVRSGLRSAMGGVGGGALQLLMYLMGAGHSQEDMDAAYHMLQQLKTPEQRQMEEMLARRSQPS